MYYLGIDTSNYTTSLALTDNDGIILADQRKVLSVKQGARGLRQSEAVFQHVENLPLLLDSINLDLKQIACVGVSTCPRRTLGSYMPVFKSGLGFAQVIAKSLGVPLLSFSHQEGHIQAGLYTVMQSLGDAFYVVHLSGGTTEILNVRKQKDGFACEIVGGTKDISAGQLIDRIGVAAGLAFPCGKEMDALAKTGKIALPSCVNGTFINFSGAEVQGCRTALKKETLPELFGATCTCIAASLEKSLQNTIKQYGDGKILMVGGVSASKWIKQHLESAFPHQIYFAEPNLSTDNAVGIALLAKEVHRG